MKILTREGIRRMVNVTGTGVGGGSIFDVGQIYEMLGSYLTVENAKQQFVSIDFFKRLFQAHGTDENDDPVDVDPNDTETTITDIEAMFGFWTNQYLSALGNGGGGTGGATALTDLVDVAIASPTNGQALVYNATTGKWINQTISGGGTDMPTVWANLAAATNEQINVSHLANALSGYAQTSALANYLPIAGGTVTGNLSVGGTLAVTGAATLSSSITAGSFIKSGGTSSQFLKADGSVDSNTYATQTWVGDNYISIAFFSRLFKAYNGTTLVSPNNTTATIDNIKAMFGFWTEQYLSALGNGGGGGTGGATALTDLVDVAVSSPTNGQALVYNSTSGKWINQTISGGGTDMATVWANLAANTNEQINASHLTDALSDYVTSQTLTGYLPLTGGTLSSTAVGVLKINKTNNFASLIGFYGNINSVADTEMGYLGCRDVDTPCFRTTGGTYYNLLHTGNFSTEIGSGLFTSLTSTNDTNLSVTIGGTTKEITGLYALWFKSANVTTDNYTTVGDLNNHNGTDAIIIQNYTGTTRWVHQPENTYGACVAFRPTSASVIGQLFWGFNHNSQTPTGNLYWRAKNNLGWADDWHKIAFADGNIATATALTTARTLWGQSFDGTANVSGNMTGVGTIDATGNNTITHSGTTASRFIAINGVGQVELMVALTNWGVYSRTNSSWIIGTNGTNTFMSVGNVGIANTSPTYNLHVGTTSTSGDVRAVVSNNNGSVGVYSSSNRGLYDFKSGSTGWIIATNGTNTWMSRGNVGIGTTSPSYLLHVNGQAAAQTFRSTVETGTAPMVVASSTLVTNLNADKLDGYDASYFASASDVTTLQGYFDSSGAALSAVQLKTTRTLWGQNFNGSANVTGDMTSVGSITLTNNSRISNATGSSGSLYIGRADDAGWVKLSDMCSRQGDSYWKIKSNGDATFGNMLSNGYVTALSDARYKTIVGDVDITVEQIASLPTILYKRNDLHDDTIFAGSIAQEWQKVLPQVVMTSNDYLGTLSIAHGVGASIFVIVTARKVVNLEKRIERLEKRVNIEQNKTE